MKRSTTALFSALMVSGAFAVTGISTQAQGIDVSDSLGVNLTIYNQNFGLVKDVRTIPLKGGVNVVNFSDVAAQIDPTTVSLQSLTAPNSIVVREQNYQYDLIDPTSILAKSIGKNLRFRQVFDNGTARDFSGILLNSPQATVADANGGNSTRYSGLVVKTADGIILNPVGQIEIAQLPEGLISKPTLVWRLETTKPGAHKTEVAYQTSGINWKSDYVAILGASDSQLNLTSWVTIDNQSGATYKDAALKLLAGDVHQVQAAPVPMMMNARGYAKESSMPQQFTEAAFAEYHLYTMQGKTTVRDRETKQLSLFTADNIPVTKLFVYEPNRQYNWPGGGGDVSKKIQVKIEVENAQKNHLGMPMPQGKVRVYKKDADGALQFIGEDAIDHTPKDEKIRLYIGDAFDLVGERVVMRNEAISDRVRRESIEVSLRNHKDSEVTIVVIEHPYGDWTMLNQSSPFRKKDSTTIEFPVKVPANGEVKLTYQIEYRS